MPDHRSSAPDWLTLEQRRVAARRSALGSGLTKTVDGQPQPLVTGLALSGGGIRSATLSLGMLQALARGNALQQFDYLSTVSGGGYAGGFLCSLFIPEKVRQGNPTAPSQAELQQAARAAQEKLQATEQRSNAQASPASKPISWLRNSGRYLAPNGGGDVWFGFTTWLRNLLAVHYVLGITLVLALGILGWLNQAALAHLHRLPWQLPGCLQAGALYGVLALGVAGTALLPLGIAYWYTEMPKLRQTGWLAGVFTFTAVVGMLLGPALWLATAAWQNTALQILAGVLVLASAWYLATWSWTWWQDRQGQPTAWMQVTRTRLTRYLSRALGSAAMLAALCLVLAVCEWLQTYLSGSYGAIGSGVVAGLLGLWKLLPVKSLKLNKPLALQWLPLLGALLLGTLLVLGWGTVAAWLLATPAHRGILLALLLLAGITGECFQFLNLSTIQNLYTARIVRAYLGATNIARDKAEHQDMTEPHATDDMALDQYHGRCDASGPVQLHSLAPLHLINVTINETVASQGSLVNQDRKGLSLAVTPDGFMVDGEFSARPHNPRQRHPFFEKLTVGRWIGISGAAFTPGLGRGTRPELAMLMVLANVRLGYWWQVKLTPKSKRTRARTGHTARRWPFATQLHLLREMRGNFYGTNDSHWYLSDGGHFENTGVYELLRRRVDFILALDNGADASYQFEDVANLMRLASVDMGAQFTPIAPETVAQRLQATPQADLASMLGNPTGFPRDEGKGRHFLLAYQVSLPATDAFAAHTALLLWVKPRLTEEASLDLRQYQATHLPFPQEPTADQFFDDQQWESYRQLGQHAGQTLLEGGVGLPGLVQALGKSATPPLYI
ncbi:Patatin-like phospholipase [Rhodoferax sp. OV413]|uniref:patatin-like phospholipase family protein n=1 Tax=Rhodoferax sp. OV413 TaxID=1855285 RepID=UPI0008922C80|nr:patatin-like phospholipase family protein [Rhodoferax sp. OV413]SDP69489.1 Patatin-like phospholipase [Rhodoferax sp. OV413]